MVEEGAEERSVMMELRNHHVLMETDLFVLMGLT